jgi:hypothetical protein
VSAEHWLHVGPEVWCRNDVIADFGEVLTGCVKGNVVPYTLGAGAGSKDSGEAERVAKHFCQRVINHTSMELEAVQAAGLVLGMGSSGASADIMYYSGWNHRKVARMVAAGGHDIDFSHEVDEEEGFLAAEAEGTGKSAMVHALSREFACLGLGKIVITAYTGVAAAAAPFGGSTLMLLPLLMMPAHY